MTILELLRYVPASVLVPALFPVVAVTFFVTVAMAQGAWAGLKRFVEWAGRLD